MRALVLALTMIATPAAAADQFDLVCEGKVGALSFSARYRVNLATREWCEDSCERTRGISAVTARTIVLYNKLKASDLDSEARISINRETGEWSDYYSSPDQGWDEIGKCEVAPFSGFPVVKRKF
jgi:hypothetical protein